MWSELLRWCLINPRAGSWQSVGPSVVFRTVCKTALKETSGHGKRLMADIDLTAKEQHHDHSSHA